MPKNVEINNLCIGLAIGFCVGILSAFLILA